MKQKLFYPLMLFMSICFAIPKASATSPAIGVTLARIGPHYVMPNLEVKIKNIGDEPLTNIYATENPNAPFEGTYTFFNNIPILQPGEVYIASISKENFSCYDASQIMVHATTVNNTEITDLSVDPNAYGNDGLPGSYYNDGWTYYQAAEPLYSGQEGNYSDLNNNGLVDVGDAVNYTYTFNNFDFNFFGCQLIDNNAIVENPIFDIIDNYSTTGIHYLTQEDVDLGYVYNSSYLIAPNTCSQIYYLNDVSYCNGCPNPSGANIITKLTDLLPNKISGSVKFNAYNDCNTALNFPNRRVSTTDGTNHYITFTNSNGNYQILITNSGNYTTTALNGLGNAFSSTPTSVATASSGENVNYNNTDFCIASTSNFTDLKVYLFNVNQAIPGFAASYRLYYENKGTAIINGSLTLHYNSSILASLSANPAFLSDINDDLTWNFSNLLPFERRYIDIQSMVLPPPVVAAGMINTLTLNGTPSDVNPGDNTSVLNQMIFSSFDPNDKTVLEGESITALQATQDLHYVTRFQNTGTANATTVVIKETLDPDLDWSTFEPIDSSHPCNIQIRNGNELTYTFSEIDLPFESANEPASHGWMTYKIKPKDTFHLGDVATSNSAIYFDFNPPVVTNSVNTSISPLSTATAFENLFTVSPNPAHQFIHINNPQNLNFQYEIISTNGQTLLMGSADNSEKIDINTLSDGFYLVQIKSPEGVTNYKLIKN